MTRSLILLFAGSWSLAAFCTVLMPFYSLAYDNYFTYIVPGSAVFGIGVGVAVFYWRGTHISAGDRWGTGSWWLAAAAVASTACLLAQLYLPIGPTVLFLIKTGFLTLPFMLGAYAVLMLWSTEDTRQTWLQIAVIAGTLTGIMSRMLLLDYAGGAIRAAWVVCAVLGMTALFCAGRRSLSFVVTGTVLVIGVTSLQINETQYFLPRWQPDSPHLIKPLLGAISLGKTMVTQPLHWDASSRIDLFESIKERAGYHSLLINGTTPLPVMEGAQPLSWWREHFPLLMVPITVSGTEDMVSIGPAIGPEVAMAQLSGVPAIDSLAYIKPTGNRPGIPSAFVSRNDKPSSHGAGSMNPRYAMLEAHKPYDLIVLPITNSFRSGWGGSNQEEQFLYTRDAMQQYWSSLQEGGMLAVTTSDETLFVRSVMTLWVMLAEQRNTAGRDFLRHAWGLRLLDLAPYKSPYQYLVMVVKGIPRNEQVNKAEEMIRQLPVEGLFGPRIRPVNPYTILGMAWGPKSAKAQFASIFNRRFQAQVDLDESTDQRPFFFHLIRDAHPYLKWLLTACLGILIPVLMFPMSQQRQPDKPGSSAHPPLPVVLAYFILLGGVVMTATVGVMQKTSLWSLAPAFDRLVLLASTVSGFGAGVLASGALAQQGIRRLGLWAPLVLVLLLGMIYWVSIYSTAGTATQPVTARLVVLAALSLALGLATGLAHAAGMRLLEIAGLNTLIPWAWLVFGVAVLAGAILANWLAMLWGWDIMWPVVAAASLSVFGIGLWTQSRASPVRERTFEGTRP